MNSMLRIQYVIRDCLTKRSLILKQTSSFQLCLSMSDLFVQFTVNLLINPFKSNACPEVKHQ